MVVLVSRYHKGYAISGEVKLVYRFLPQPVGEMVILYLWIVLPFQ